MSVVHLISAITTVVTAIRSGVMVVIANIDTVGAGSGSRRGRSAGGTVVVVHGGTIVSVVVGSTIITVIAVVTIRGNVGVDWTIAIADATISGLGISTADGNDGEKGNASKLQEQK